jgi:uncharacterized delta-60 repeat protein
MFEFLMGKLNRKSKKIVQSSANRHSRAQSTRRLVLEHLETRELLSGTHIWTGYIDGLWNNASNWTGGVPSDTNNIIQFEATNYTKAMTNNLPSGVTFSSIEFSASNYSIMGNTIKVSSYITVESGVTNTTIAANVNLNTTSNVLMYIDGPLTISGTVSGMGNLILQGYNTLTLSGNNSYKDTQLDYGVLSIASQSNLGSGGLTFDGGTLQITTSCTISKNATLNADGGTIDVATGQIVNFSGVIKDGTTPGPLTLGDLAMSHTGTIAFTNAMSYTGATTIKWNTLSLQQIDGNAIAHTSSLTVGQGGTLDLNGRSNTLTGTLILNNGLIEGSNQDNGPTGTISSPAYDLRNGVIWQKATLAGTGAVTKSTMYTVTFMSANTYTGSSIDITGGDLCLYDQYAVTSECSITIDKDTGEERARLWVEFDNTATGPITLVNGTIDGVAGRTLTSTAYNVQSGTISINLGGSAALTKTGPETVSLSGGNTYDGDTNIQGGTLEISSTGDLSASSHVLLSSETVFHIAGGTHTLGSVYGFIDGNYVGNVSLTDRAYVSFNSLICYSSGMTSECEIDINRIDGGYHPPITTNVASPDSDDTYTTGDTIQVNVTFDEDVTVTGTPRLRMYTGENEVYADYSSGSGTSTLTFDYTVQVGDNTSDLDYWGTGALDLNGGSIQNAYQINANLALDVPGNANSLSANSDLVIVTPYLTANGTTSVAEGSPFALQLAAGNLGSHTILSWQIDWGDGNTDTYTTNPSQVTHVFADDGYYMIDAIAILDDETIVAGGPSGTHAVNVTNVAPYLSIRGEAAATANSAYTLHLFSSDPGDDTIQYWTIDWGDGNIESVSGNPAYADHYFANSGDYSISATATDEDGTYSTGGGDAGSLYAAFGDGGNAIVSSVANVINGWAEGMAVQADGKIVFVGYDCASGNSSLVRCNADGSLDTSFGDNGHVADAPGASVFIQADGKIVAFGYNSTDCVIARYLSDGSPDTNFGNDGEIVINSINPWTMAMQSDGKMLVGGAIADNSQYDFAIARYNIDGSLDTDFGANGIATVNFCEGSWENVASICVQSDGKIVVAGSVNYENACAFGLARFTSDGELDASFGDSGKSITPFDATVHYLAIGPDGRIIAGGVVGVSEGTLAMACYNSDGTLDTTFGTGGKLVDNSFWAYGWAVQSDGKIIVVGGTGTNYFSTMRFLSDGSVDTSFGDQGVVTADTGAGFDCASVVRMLCNGQILTGGLAQGGGVAMICCNPGIISLTVTVS